MLRLFLLLSFSCVTNAQLLKASHTSLDKLLGGITDFTPHGTQPDLNFDILETTDCGDCHGNSAFGGITDDKNYMPLGTWAGSMMANATRDPLFWASVDIANQDIPGVGDFCIRCHTPMGFYNGHTKDGTGDMDYANGCKLAGTVTATESKLNDYQGINCHFCHRQEEKGPSNEPLILNNGNVWIDDENCDSPGSSAFGPCRKGPYKDYSTNPDVNTPPHAWKYDSFIKKGEFCGSCHNVSSPEIMTNGTLTIAKTLIDATGTDLGVAMPIERTFAEWQSSLFSDLIYKDGFGGDSITEMPNLTQGQTCQDCHMPQSSNSNTRACIFNANGVRQDNLKMHEFAGGNSWMPEVMKNIYGAALDSNDFSRSEAFDRTIASALDMLQNKSAIVTTTLVSSTATDAEVSVKVTNITGHKLPTGYPEGRRMWINLIASDNNGATIYESGIYNSSTAVLTQTGTKIYESLQGIWNAANSTCETSQGGSMVFHFALNNCIAKDNRIPPLGFRGGNDIEIRPIAITYPIRPNHPQQLVNFDETTYDFAIPNGTPLPISITATLKYQTASKEYIDFLDAESTTSSENDLCNRTQTDGPADQSRSAFMKQLWTDNGKSAPVDMASSTIQILSNL